MGALHKLLFFNERAGKVGGALVQFQPGPEEVNALPFPIGKVLLMYDIKPDDIRGRHAHYETEEIFTVLKGACTVVMDDGKGCVEEVRLTAETECGMKQTLLLYPHIWRTVKDFSEDTRLMAVANRPHDESDYIRDYDEFLTEAKSWGGLGGSSENSEI